MELYPVNRRELLFQLNEWSLIASLNGGTYDAATITQLVDSAIEMAQQQLAPVNRDGDRFGVVQDNGLVRVARSFHSAYAKFCESGFLRLTAREQWDGLQAPMRVGLAIGSILSGANTALMIVYELTSGVVELLDHYASDSLKQVYVPPLLRGIWNGTMCLTEAGAGSSVGDTVTQAVLGSDCEWWLKGEKIFISWGQSDLHDNTVHMVLARVPGSPSGTKGLSLFLVPRCRVDNQGNIIGPNDVKVTKVEEKMGVHGSPTCVMSFGENDQCLAYLIGEVNQGMAIMFRMMNHARVYVGSQGVGQAMVCSLRALQYIEERIQFKQPLKKFPGVREMIMRCKALAEGIQALLFFTGSCHDRGQAGCEDAADWTAAGELLTPVAKAYITDQAGLVIDTALQVLGGYGYISEYLIEQDYRDHRVQRIYEGANGIQALDLIGRKMRLNGGGAFQFLMDQLARLAGLATDPYLMPLNQQFQKYQPMLMTTVLTMLEQSGSSDPKISSMPVLNAYPFLTMLGHTVTAALHIDMAREALSRLRVVVPEDNDWPTVEAGTEAAYLWNKYQAARYFTSKVLPEVGLLAESYSSTPSLDMVI